jgi:multicomponent Na+:H+ antiporter subunit D
MFFVAAMALIGVPPLSGFIGKLLIIRGGFQAEFYYTAAISLLLNLLLLYSLMKIFMNAFWGKGEEAVDNAEVGTFKAGRLLASTAGLFIIMVLLGLCAEWIYPFVSQAGEVLLDSQLYIQSVLGKVGS